MEEKLFDAFEQVSRQQWLDKITTDLKGKDYKDLHWQAAGLSGEPVFTREDLPDNLADLANISQQPELFGARHWVNYQWVKVESEKTANAKALHALNHGASGIIFHCDTAPDWKTLLEGIQLEYCHLGLTGPNRLVQSFEDHCTAQGIDHSTINGFSVQNTKPIIGKEQIGFKYLNIEAAHSLPVIELASALAVAANLYDELTEKGGESPSLLAQTQFQLSLGNSYFAEIAKFRAMRGLVIRFASAYGVTLANNEVQIMGMSSDWTTPLDDPHSHMLHATPQAMAAIIGGADALCIKPFYPVFDDDALAERAARNISSILSEESYLAKVVDPSAGTYYIEWLTAQMCEQAWALFLAIEEAGGSNAIDPATVETLHQKITA